MNEMSNLWIERISRWRISWAIFHFIWDTRLHQQKSIFIRIYSLFSLFSVRWCVFFFLSFFFLSLTQCFVHSVFNFYTKQRTPKFRNFLSQRKWYFELRIDKTCRRNALLVVVWMIEKPIYAVCSMHVEHFFSWNWNDMLCLLPFFGVRMHNWFVDYAMTQARQQQNIDVYLKC